MSIFPKNESEILDLAEAMVAGYAAHSGDFPSISAETLTELQETLNSYKTCKDQYADAKSQMRLKTIGKAEDLAYLMDFMKGCLKKSEGDCTALPEKLYEIGWGPRATPQPTQPPYTPANLRSVAEGPGDIWLEWEVIARAPLNNWVIERRDEPSPGAEFGPWKVVGTSIETSVHLLEQPRGVQLEYRVRGVNTAGEGQPSTVLAAVL
jgi:hypothetical protein